MIIIIQIVLVLIVISSILQVTKLLKLPNSKLNSAWLFTAVPIVLLAEYLIFNLVDNKNNQLILLSIVTLSLLSNHIKFSFGYIQKDEITFYNRIEHFLAGLIIFYFLDIIKLPNLLKFENSPDLYKGLIMTAFTNLGSVLFEIAELVADKIGGKKHLIGPRVYDTNFDILMILLGSIAGMSIWLLTKA